ncbi:hypothetical protein [Streptomyces sp. ME02-6978.2a]|uniref:hypothetical protein n=1 Tax=Streptomyces sp. ME02-6978.2a TaxID=462922 RepID=UPI0029B8B7AA|nr:hypothetical protein [Streptomyces sp. ME02-6978.2a]MDX3360592.1 hypothetical protein [Streptomyces sp. ME02-6978.2a]
MLLSQGRGLTYVQRRLGHESIKTTSDTYGHLLPEADDDAMEIIDRSLTRGGPDDGGRPQVSRAPGGGPAAPAVPAQGAGSVHVVAFPGGVRQGFWRQDFARMVAEVWPVARWQARYGGVDGVHSSMPARAKVWSLGPAAYGPDGEELASGPGAHELRTAWAWEWEPGFTTEPAEWAAVHCQGPGARTEATAWGTQEKQVRAAFVQARERALRICAQHPAAPAAVRQSDL